MNQLLTPPLVVEQYIQIPRPKPDAFALLADPALISGWMPVVEFEPCVGGRLVLSDEELRVEGEVITFDPPRGLAYTWELDDASPGERSEVRWDLGSLGAGTVVHLTHAGFGDAEQRARHGRAWGRWVEALVSRTRGERTWIG